MSDKHMSREVVDLTLERLVEMANDQPARVGDVLYRRWPINFETKEQVAHYAGPDFVVAVAAELKRLREIERVATQHVSAEPGLRAQSWDALRALLTGENGARS